MQLTEDAALESESTFNSSLLWDRSRILVVVVVLGEPQKTEHMKMLELAKF